MPYIIGYICCIRLKVHIMSPSFSLHPSNGPCYSSNNIESESLGFATFPGFGSQRSTLLLWKNLMFTVICIFFFLLCSFFATDLDFYSVSIVFIDLGRHLGDTFCTLLLTHLIHSCIHISSQLKILTIHYFVKKKHTQKHTLLTSRHLVCGHRFDNSAYKQ